ncbi:MAG: carboxypeptidase-like regulatory domain-containing protein [Terriglobales bacterium]
MKTILPVLACIVLAGCSKHPANSDLAKQGITVCGVLTDDNQQPIANAFIELHRSAKDPTAFQTRYQVGRTDDKGQFDVQGVPQGQYWMAVVSKGPCNPKSKEENESRRVEVDVPNGNPGADCKTHWQVVQDTSCKVTVE